VGTHTIVPASSTLSERNVNNDHCSLRKEVSCPGGSWLTGLAVPVFHNRGIASQSHQGTTEDSDNDRDGDSMDGQAGIIQSHTGM
jgi:hypothetical protein